MQFFAQPLTKAELKDKVLIKIPVWEDGRVVYKIPEVPTERSDEGDAKNRAFQS